MAETGLKTYAIDNKGIEGLTVQLKEKQQKGLRFPANYSVENALNSAYLMLKQAVDKNDKPLLEVCTQESVINSLMSMATQGLNPIKKQCYFIAMGNKCTLMSSYFGTLAVTKRVAKVIGEPVANLIYKGDVFEYEYDVQSGEKHILKHEQKLENIDNSNIIGAYAIVRTEKQYIVEIMNINQIKSSWGMGAARGNSKAHLQFAEEMCKKTVLNRACKQLVNSSDDSSVVGDEVINEFNKTDDNDYIDSTAVEVKQEVEEKANKNEFKMDIQEEKYHDGGTVENKSTAVAKEVKEVPVSESNVEIPRDF